MKETADSVFASIQNDLFEEEENRAPFDNDETLKDMLSLVRKWFDFYGKHQIENEKDHSYVLRELGVRLSVLKPKKHETKKKKREMNLSKAERERRRTRMKEYWAKKKAGEDTGSINSTLGNPVPDESKSKKKAPAKK